MNEGFRWHPEARLYDSAGHEVIPRSPPPPSHEAEGSRLSRPAIFPDSPQGLAAAIGHPAFRIGAPDQPLPDPHDQPILETLTSGSTGQPRRIRRTQASWTASFAVKATLGIGPGARIATLGRLIHSLSLYGAIEGLHLGAKVHLLADLRPDRQRAALAQQTAEGTHPHVLVMTATPIPRTVAMTVFGDLDVSTLTQIPEGRADVTTHVVDPLSQPRHMDRLWQRAAEEIVAGHRVFIVCPRIDAHNADGDRDFDQPGTDGRSADEEDEFPESGPQSIATVEDVLKEARARLPEARIAALHGRLPAEEKDSIMRGLVDGSIDAVVSTTVIEVGVDVPDATMMVVLDADRFGISQLHQLRGRIGRGRLPGVCLLFSSADAGTPARERLDAVASTRDGFALAQRDLEIRREGDVLGGSQSGVRSSLRLLRVVEDADVIARARSVAEELLDQDPELQAQSGLRAAIARLDAEQSEFLEKA